MHVYIRPARTQWGNVGQRWFRILAVFVVVRYAPVCIRTYEYKYTYVRTYIILCSYVHTNTLPYVHNHKHENVLACLLTYFHPRTKRTKIYKNKNLKNRK